MTCSGTCPGGWPGGWPGGRVGGWLGGWVNWEYSQLELKLGLSLAKKILLEKWIDVSVLDFY